MSPTVIAALVTAASALAVALYSARAGYRRDQKLRELGFSYDTKLEGRKSELSREDAIMKARTEYEYNARLSLYQRFEPLLFQLVDLANYALDRIKNLTKPSVWAEFVLAESSQAGSGRPPMAKADYELVSTVYGLFAPLVIVRSMSRQLTLVDLSLEQRIELPYYVASHIYSSFNDDAKLAAMHPAVSYDPFHPEWRERRETCPETYWWQGLRMGRLENILDLLSIPGAELGGTRLCSFGEFERNYEHIQNEGKDWERKALGIASNPLVSFRPEKRPVYWRMLIAQACLYQALLRTLRDSYYPASEEDWIQYLRLEDENDFTWKQEGHIPKLNETLEAATGYLHRYVVAPRIVRGQRSGGRG
jgi:hypothetical protein